MLPLLFSFRVAPEKRISSRFRREKIRIDGSLEEWKNQKPAIITGEKAGSENRLKIRSEWDNDFLYLAFEVVDLDLRAYQTVPDDPRLFLDDMVEVLLDAVNQKDSCWGTDDIVYHINLLGIKKDDRGTTGCQSDPTWNGEARYVVKMMGTLNDTLDIDVGYHIEMGIPWKELGIHPVKGTKLGVNFADGDNDGKGRQLFDWAGAWPMRSPYAFGNLVLH